MKLEFVKRLPDYTVYRRTNGDLVYLTDPKEIRTTTPHLYKIETAQLFPPLTRDNTLLHSEWHHFSRRRFGDASKEAFLDFLREVLTDPSPVDETGWCTRCDIITSTAIGGVKHGQDSGQLACFTCSRYFRVCEMCKVKSLNTQPAGRYRRVCEPCLQANFEYCRNCGVYYDNETYLRDHKHGNGCCESPQLEFSVRLLDNPPLVNDVKQLVTLGAGTIDPAGVKRITSWLQNNGYPHEAVVMGQMDTTWQKKDGNFPKRLSKQVWKTYNRKVSAEALAMIGTIGAEHSAKGSEIAVMISRQLNNPPAWWFHGGSCWWTSAYASRCALKTNGGFGLLTYESVRHSKPNGRAWVLPVKRTGTEYLAPTFETMEPDGFIVFNGYGALAEYAGARVMAGLAGMTYRKITFMPKNPIYANAGGFLVGSEDFVEPYTDGAVFMHEMRQHATLFEEEQRAGQQTVIDLRSKEQERADVVA